MALRRICRYYPILNQRFAESWNGMSEHGRHDALVMAAIRRLGREAVDGSMSSRLLAGGLSGSSVYSVDLDGEEAILKLTLPSKDGHLPERALRESCFYQELVTRVPLKVPRVLGLNLDETAGAALLLAAYKPSPPPEQWTDRDYVEVSRQLGRFHATFWDQAAEPTLPDWIQDKPPVTLEQCRAAAARWQSLSERDEIRETLKPHHRNLERLFLQIPELDPRMITVPPTLCHGDCHTGNLLRDRSGEWVWADWQEIRLGPGPDDLAFFWQRAFAATDVRPPYEAMIHAYRAGLESVGENLLSEDQLNHQLAWSELRCWLVDWPNYLGYLAPARIQPVLQRITALIDRFGI